MNEYQRRIDYKEFESYISAFSDLHEEEKASLFYIGPGQRSQAGGSGGIGPIHRYTLFSLHRVHKTWNNFLPIYENREIKKKSKILASFEKVINLAVVDGGFYVAVSPWWELSCSFLG